MFLVPLSVIIFSIFILINITKNDKRKFSEIFEDIINQ
jgi:hypothetical protein